MLNEQQFRLRLNDVHILISDVLEHVDERAFASADAALENMQAEIGRLRGHVWSNLNVRSVLPSASSQPPDSTSLSS